MLRIRNTTLISALVTLAACAMLPGRVSAAENHASAQEKQQKLISVLKSDAPASEKAITCKQLAIYGSKDAVPALAALLPDKDLSSWARIALEAIPDPAADEALRNALGKVQGRLLIGVINSIAYRRDAQAVDALAQHLKNPDAEVASSAAAALGRIGGNQAAAILEPALAGVPTSVRPAVAEGCIYCAERLIADGSREKAIKLYDAVRKTELPKQRILEATRGAILARQSAGIPLLVETLRSQDKAIFGIGLRTARELPGSEVTDALLAELDKATPDRQALLIITLADRADAKALPAVLAAARSGPTNVRIAAATVLERLGNASCVPVLVDAAAADDPDLAQAAKTSLARLGGKDVEADLFARLQQSAGKQRQVLIELVEQRRMDGAVPVFIQCAQDADPGVRTAALVAIGAIGEEKHAADLATLLQKAQDPKQRADIEKALMAISSRYGAACVKHLLPLAQSEDRATRIVSLRALACSGGPEALAAVKSASNDKDEAVQDEAVRTLSTWANRWPDDAAVTEPLLALAQSGKKPQHQILALRGYLQFVQGARRIKPDERLAKMNQVLPLITRPEEKRLAISAFSAIGTPGVLPPLSTFAADSAISEEACSAIVALAARNNRGASKEQIQSALKTVVEKSKNDATRKKAQELLENTR